MRGGERREGEGREERGREGRGGPRKIVHPEKFLRIGPVCLSGVAFAIFLRQMF